MNAIPTATLEHVLDILALNQFWLVPKVANTLVDVLPPVGVPASSTMPRLIHQQQVHSTVQRIHDVVQHGARLSWSLVSHEYAWAAGVLPRLGITWEHHTLTITTYFAIARQIEGWSPAEVQVLTDLERQILSLGEAAYRGNS